MAIEKQGKIRVSCEAAATLPLDSLLDFQGGIKTITDENLGKLKRRIVEHGINAPVFVWKTKGNKPKHYIVDGHQRSLALRELRDEGYDVPDVPVAFIEAKSKKDAADKLLGITSQYGSFDSVEFGGWLATMDLDLDQIDVRVVDYELSIFSSDGEIPEDNKDIDEEAMADTQNECPKCGFTW